MDKLLTIGVKGRMLKWIHNFIAQVSVPQNLKMSFQNINKSEEASTREQPQVPPSLM
jgi:hypothetical protein